MSLRVDFAAPDASCAYTLRAPALNASQDNKPIPAPMSRTVFPRKLVGFCTVSPQSRHLPLQWAAHTHTAHLHDGLPVRCPAIVVLHRVLLSRQTPSRLFGVYRLPTCALGVMKPVQAILAWHTTQIKSN
jgi:hypothetical protein